MREFNGKFTSFKRMIKNFIIRVVKFIIISGLIVSAVVAFIYYVKYKMGNYEADAYTASSTPVQVFPATKRVDQVQQLIDSLSQQVESDPQFQKETAKQEAELKEERHQAAIEGALLIIKTQYDQTVYEDTKTVK